MIGTPGGSVERPALFFDDVAQFRAWLQDNHDSATELWVGFFKKHTGRRTIAYQDAVAEALCFGWIDGVAQRIDDDTSRQRWTPRKPGSIWSKVNVATVERLTAEGRMHPAGLAAYARRRPDRTGVYSFEQEDELVLPDAYAAHLAADGRATAFWERATPAYRKVAVHWVLSAKQEATRDKRMRELVDDSAHGRLIKIQRYGTPPVWVARVRTELGIGD